MNHPLPRRDRVERVRARPTRSSDHAPLRFRALAQIAVDGVGDNPPRRARRQQAQRLQRRFDVVGQADAELRVVFDLFADARAGRRTADAAESVVTPWLPIVSRCWKMDQFPLLLCLCYQQLRGILDLPRSGPPRCGNSGRNHCACVRRLPRDPLPLFFRSPVPAARRSTIEPGPKSRSCCSIARSSTSTGSRRPSEVKGGKLLNRAEIIRALIDGLIDSGMDIKAELRRKRNCARASRVGWARRTGDVAHLYPIPAN